MKAGPFYQRGSFYSFAKILKAMKKLFHILTTVAAVLFVASCDKDDPTPDGGNGVLKSYERAVMMSGEVHFRYVYTPTWNAEGKLTSVKMEHYENPMNWETGKTEGEFLAERSTTTYTWNNSAYTAELRETNEWHDTDNDTWTPGNGHTASLKFDQNWRVTEVRKNYSDGSTGVFTYTYSGDHLASWQSGDTNTYTWKDGDMVAIAREGYSASVTYLDEANPFADSVDPIIAFFDDCYALGLAGKRTAHLPSTFVETWGTGTDASTYYSKYIYKKDGSGRIIEVDVMYTDANGNVNESSESHYNAYRFNY